MTDLDTLIAAVEEGRISSGLIMAALDVTTDQLHCLAAFDGSLDAVERLHEALLPGMGWDIWRTLDHTPNGESRAMYGCNLPMIDTAYSPVASRAWLLAILRALKAKEYHNGTA